MADIHKIGWKWRGSRVYVQELAHELYLTCIETKGEPIRVRLWDPHITIEGAIKFTDHLVAQLKAGDTVELM